MIICDINAQISIKKITGSGSRFIPLAARLSYIDCRRDGKHNALVHIRLQQQSRKVRLTRVLRRKPSGRERGGIDEGWMAGGPDGGGSRCPLFMHPKLLLSCINLFSITPNQTLNFRQIACGKIFLRTDFHNKKHTSHAALLTIRFETNILIR